MTLTDIYYLHEIGGKKNNEDYIWPVPGTASLEDRIFIVCDGVGGSENGEIASKIVAQSVGTGLLKSSVDEIDATFINRLLADARQNLIDYARQHSLSTNMATTFSLLTFIGEKAFIAWCGDSRVYHIRHGEILFKTDDHSLVNSLVRSGEITPEEALAHPQKNMLLKAISADDSDAEAEGQWIEEVLDGDYFLLCTDGLLENIGDRDIKFLLEQNDKGSIDLVQSIQKFCYEKTRDNYSMYLVRVSAEEKQILEKKKSPLRWWILGSIPVLAAAALVIKENYLSPRRQVINVVTPTNMNKDSIEKADSVPDTTVTRIVPTPVAGKPDSIKNIPPKVSGNVDSSTKHTKPPSKTDASGKETKPLPKTDSAGEHSNPISPADTTGSNIK